MELTFVDYGLAHKIHKHVYPRPPPSSHPPRLPRDIIIIAAGCEALHSWVMERERSPELMMPPLSMVGPPETLPPTPAPTRAHMWLIQAASVAADELFREDPTGRPPVEHGDAIRGAAKQALLLWEEWEETGGGDG